MKKTVAAGSAFLAAVTGFAHPGHAPGDVVAEVSSPLAGPDHLIAFLVATAVAALTVRTLVKFLKRRGTSAADSIRPR